MVLDVIRFFILFCYAPTQIITTTATITTMVISLATLSTSSNPCPRCSYNVTTYNRYDTFGFHHFFVPVCDNTNTPKKKKKKNTRQNQTQKTNTVDVLSKQPIYTVSTAPNISHMFTSGVFLFLFATRCFLY